MMFALTDPAQYEKSLCPSPSEGSHYWKPTEVPVAGNYCCHIETAGLYDVVFATTLVRKGKKQEMVHEKAVH